MTLTKEAEAAIKDSGKDPAYYDLGRDGIVLGVQAAVP